MHPPIADLPPLTHEGAECGFATMQLDTGPLLIRYNSQAALWVGHPELPIRLGFVAPLNQPEPGGMPSQDENLLLNDIEDALFAEIDATTPALHALTLTTGVMREFVFYLPKGVDIARLHQTLQAAITTHTIQCRADEDPEWQVFRELTPGEEGE